MTAMLARWMKFNFVGGIGIVVQFAMLFFLKSIAHLNYLFATALAVEAAIIHNFVWHERFTWVDRTGFDTTKIDTTKIDRTKPDRTKLDQKCRSALSRPSARISLARCWRFNLSTGAVSILGNLALMKLLVGFGHMNYLTANGIAIALCTLANFLASDAWVFG